MTKRCSKIWKLPWTSLGRFLLFSCCAYLSLLLYGKYSPSSPQPILSVWEYSVIPNETQSGCHLASTAHVQQSTVRIIIFQRDSGTQLLRALRHYSEVLPPSSIVIIDHLGDDSYTASVINSYAILGVHVWRCVGQFVKRKAMLWSEVIKVYSPYSDFVFPVDVDELLTVKGDADVLEWSSHALRAALAELSDTGKPFKMQWASSVPHDCPISVIDNARVRIELSEFCLIRFLSKSGLDCQSKCFARGKDFIETHQGNHLILTTGYRNRSSQAGLESKGRFACSQERLADLYEVNTRFVLAHIQQLNFGQWVSHVLRGATDYQFNKLPQGAKCHGRGAHYCRAYQQMTAVNFSYLELHKQYTKQLCPLDTSSVLHFQRVSRIECQGSGFRVTYI